MSSKADSNLDVEALYLTLNPRLCRILQRNLRAPEWVVEDASQLAWEALIRCEERVSAEHVLGWLATTARREAFGMLARAAAELPLNDDPGACAAVIPLAWSRDPYHEVVLRERLGRLGELPRRQQRLIWMRGLGFAYPEMAAKTGDSSRTVERQLIHAGRRLAASSLIDAA